MSKVRALLVASGFAALVWAVLLVSPWLGAIATLLSLGGVLLWAGGRGALRELTGDWLLLWLVLLLCADQLLVGLLVPVLNYRVAESDPDFNLQTDAVLRRHSDPAWVHEQLADLYRQAGESDLAELHTQLAERFEEAADR